MSIDTIAQVNAQGASSHFFENPAVSANPDGSDYGDFGSDQEELEIIDDLLVQLASQQANASLIVTDIEDYEPPRGVRLLKILGTEQSTRQWEAQVLGQRAKATVRDAEATDSEKRDHSIEAERTAREQSAPSEAPPSKPDHRSPLERFRRPPMKVLSVTDLVSPAWCELQYFYMLSKHGRKRRTPAMRQGTAVHKALEDEVHTTVPVETKKWEDSWGLRIWNIIQGLQTLRDTGRTRELEIWGTVGGEIVNGVIDDLKYECPDPKLEKQLNGNALMDQETTPPEYQTSMVNYLLSAGQREQGQGVSDALRPPPIPRRASMQEQRIYLTDVKTRASPTLPTGSGIRPTVLQLHLYHHMLENLAQGNFSLVLLAERYKFDVNEPFSDAFIAQIGSLNQGLFDAVSSSPEAQFLSSQDSMDILLQHNNLSSLWDFMISQFRLTFLLPATPANETPTPTPQSTSDIPPPHSQPTRLSPILTASYLAPSYRHSKKAIGSKSFVFNPQFLKTYLEDNLAWWRGERPAQGVELQEAWKCRGCDFRNDCEWIHERDEAALKESLERKKMREAAGIDTGEGKANSRSKSTV